jgi:hypothetical protein
VKFTPYAIFSLTTISEVEVFSGSRANWLRLQFGMILTSKEVYLQAEGKEE